MYYFASLLRRGQECAAREPRTIVADNLAWEASGQPALAADKARPELSEALTLRRGTSAKQPEVGHLVLARAVGDAALEEAARAIAARADVEPGLRLATLFEPDGAEEKGRLVLFVSLGTGARPAAGTAP